MGLMDEVSVHELTQMTKGRKDVSLVSFLMKATSMALEDFPELNATVNEDASEILLNPHHHLGLAMDTPRGLLVPVVAHTDQKSVMEIHAEISKLKEQGKLNKLGPAQLITPTFTLSNIGSLGGTHATPLIAPPQLGIGAFGRAKRVPVFESPSSMAVREDRIMPVSWTADHRFLDGATLARFSNRFKHLLEHPLEMLIRLR